MVFLNSRTSQASQECRNELEVALMHFRRIYPVDLGAGMPPHPLLLRWQGIAFDGTIDASIRRLTDKLKLDEDPALPRWQGDRSPYPGLLPMGLADAEVFFGREAETAKLTERVGAPPRPDGGNLIVVIGPSGSGKSSLVGAGLAARLSKPGSAWVVAGPFVPGAEPLSQLAVGLAATVPGHLAAAECRQLLRTGGLGRVAGRLAGAPGTSAGLLLVVVDQAEHLVNDIAAAEAEQFLAVLGSGLEPGSPVTVVTTVRSDRFDEIQRLPVIGAMINEPFVLRPMDHAQLRAVIEGPAALAGLSIEPSLTSLLINEPPAAVAPRRSTLCRSWPSRSARCTTTPGESAGPFSPRPTRRSRPDRGRDQEARRVRGITNPRRTQGTARSPAAALRHAEREPASRGTSGLPRPARPRRTGHR